MTQEEKSILLQDLYARLPHRVIFKCECDENLQEIYYIKDEEVYTRTYPHLPYWIETIKPYLRPMSSMTEEEKKELSERYVWKINDSWIEIKYHSDGYWDNDIYCPTEEYLWLFDWLNKHYFDYRGLIEKGLALEASEGMYNLEKK